MRPKYLTFDRAFEKAFNKYKESLTDTERDKLRSKFEIFVEDIFDKRLRTHKLKGSMSIYYAFSISYSERIVFRVLEDGGILLIAVGSHDEVY
jgi:mRNA-degrading endonuclease YafQ of YafQ-DinJ toxin-antitoxin module